MATTQKLSTGITLQYRTMMGLKIRHKFAPCGSWIDADIKRDKKWMPLGCKHRADLPMVIVKYALKHGLEYKL